MLIKETLNLRLVFVVMLQGWDFEGGCGDEGAKGSLLKGC